jgi:putative PIN family toxin of toxin-antitoxin system
LDSDPNSFAPHEDKVVIDTNIVLDLYLFNDEAIRPLRNLIAANAIQWLATPPMRIELERVLGYPQIVPRLAHHQLSPADILEQFDLHTLIVQVAPKASITCADPDDQCFIDLAIQHQSRLISKDREVLKMKKRLAALGARAGRTLAETTA